MDAEPRRTRILIGVVLILGLLLVGQALLAFVTSPLHMVTRAAALVGYQLLFGAILSYQYRRQMLKMFGRPFLKAHHILAVSGLVLIVAHPISYAVQVGSLAVFVPDVSSLDNASRLAGRPALYLFLVATAAGVVRNRIKASWKLVHYLNYVAFVMAFVHGWLIGTDLGTGVLRWVYALMAIVVALAFFERRWSEQRSARGQTRS